MTPYRDTAGWKAIWKRLRAEDNCVVVFEGERLRVVIGKGEGADTVKRIIEAIE